MSTVYKLAIPLRWGDMDAYGHVNNVTMVQILEEARVALFGPPPSSGEPALERQVPLPLFATLPAGTQALVAENRVKYRNPLAYRGVPVRVEMQISKVTAASVAVTYELYDPVTETHCVSASTTLAFFNTQTGSLVRLSPDQRQKLSQ
ncbi:MAG: thioesterase family protein [Rothia sp. (in: high G+C Gram-positive bacteria)]|nr:thioesterase family protein [Rothia sp. (in: high G+C Gram-positive bacteria)]